MSEKSQHMWWTYVKSQFSRREFHGAIYTTFVQEWRQNSQNTAYRGGERSLPTLTQLVSRRRGCGGAWDRRARHSAQQQRATDPAAQESAFQRAQSKMAGLSQAFLPEPETSRLVLDILKWKDETFRCNFQMFKRVLEKAEEPEIKLPTSVRSSKKQEISRKHLSAWLTMPKPLTVWITTNYENFLKRWECQTTSPASWETCMQVKKQQLKLDLEQQTG